MSWRVTAAVVLAAFASVHAQQAQDPVRFPNRDWLRWPPGREAPRGGVIIGTVIDAETGRGVPRTRVTLTGEGRAFPIVTDTLGRYYFVALPPGEYRLQAERPGFVPGEFGRLRPDGEGHPIALEPDEWRTDGDIRLWRTAVISGFVGNEIGEPVVGVRVQAMRREFAAGAVRLTSVHAETTDDRGEFRISGLTPGNYLVMTPSVQVTVPLSTFERVAQMGSNVGGIGMLLTFNISRDDTGGASRALVNMVFDDDEQRVRLGASVAAPPAPVEGRRFAYPSQYYPSTDHPMLATPVRVEAGEEFSGVSFYLWPLPTARVSGHVVGSDGPVGDQLLRLLPDTGEDFGLGYETAVTMSEPDGAFTFTAVPRGAYVIDARDPASLQALEPASGSSPGSATTRPRSNLSSTTPVTVAADDIEDLTIVMTEGATVGGQVAFSNRPRPDDDGLTQVRVSLHPVEGGRSGGVGGQVDETGGFSISNVLPGAYYVDVTSPPGWQVESISADGRDATSEPLEVAGGDALVVNVDLTDRRTELWGTVRDRRGFVVATAAVLAFPAGSDTLPPLRTRVVRTNTSGVFRITGLPPGTYRIAAIPETDAGGWQEPSRLSAIRAGAIAVRLGPGDLRNQDLRLAALR